jgi:hypothetical protein
MKLNMKRILLLSLFCAVSSLHAYHNEALFYSWDANTSYLRIGIFPSHVQTRMDSKAGEYNEVLDRAKFKEIAMFPFRFREIWCRAGEWQHGVTIA